MVVIEPWLRNRLDGQISAGEGKSFLSARQV